MPASDREDETLFMIKIIATLYRHPLWRANYLLIGHLLSEVGIPGVSEVYTVKLPGAWRCPVSQ